MNELMKKFSKTYEFCHGDINKFILMFRKGVYLYEYMDNQEINFSELILEDISDEDYIQVQKIFKEFKLKNPHEYRDLYLKSDVLLSADVFENFRKMCLETNNQIQQNLLQLSDQHS